MGKPLPGAGKGNQADLPPVASGAGGGQSNGAKHSGAGKAGPAGPSSSARGRPAKKESSPASPSLGVKEPGAGTSPDSRPRPIVKVTEKEAKQNAAEVAQGVVVTADNLVGSAFGDECRMTGFEHKAIESSLAKVLGRMEPGTVEVVAQYTDPLVLVVTTMGWLLRIVRIMQERQAEEQTTGGAQPAAAKSDKPDKAAPPPVKEEHQPGKPGFVPTDAQLAKALGGMG